MRDKSDRLARQSYSVLVFGLLSLAAGCSGRAARLESQDFDISSVVKMAMSQLDGNGDAKIDQNEMHAAPSLIAALPAIDSDADGTIGEDELAARIEFWRASRVAVMPANCRVTDSAGQPLVGATVSFEPEPFLAEVLHEATGTIGRGGIAAMSVADEHRPAPQVRGVFCGLYRVRVSLVRNGKESISDRFNTQTVLGTEVYPNQVPQHDFRLTGG